jgi:hypothetical protein
MSRTPLALLAAGVLAVALGACSAGAQGGCAQPPVQSYPSPSLVTPTDGATQVPTNIGSILITVASSQIVGSLGLVAPAGFTIPLTPIPDGTTATGAAQWKAAVPALAPASTYTMTYTLTYPAGCQVAQDIVKTSNVGHFTTQ